MYDYKLRECRRNIRELPGTRVMYVSPKIELLELAAISSGGGAFTLIKD